jgi:hypothetical protein
MASTLGCREFHKLRKKYKIIKIGVGAKSYGQNTTSENGLSGAPSSKAPTATFKGQYT